MNDERRELVDGDVDIVSHGFHPVLNVNLRIMFNPRLVQRTTESMPTDYLSWAMSPNVANLSPRHMKCLQFGKVIGNVTTFCDVANSKPPFELAILYNSPN